MELPALKTSLKRVVQGVFEHLWSPGFRLAGRWSGAAPSRLRAQGGEQILIVAPHPDDEVAGCVGAILEHRRGGDRVRVVCVTDGRRSRALGLTAREMASTRRQEAEAAAEILGVELEWLGLPEGEWQIEALVGRLRESLAAAQPGVVYAPSRVDFHPEHRKVAVALARALVQDFESETGEAPEIRVYAVQVPLTPILCNLVLPVSTREGEIERCVAAYRSQRGTLEPCLRHRRNLGRLYGHRSAEEFWRLTATQYEQLHHEAPEQGTGAGFRGLRYYAWSDPFAYWVGRGERQRLAAQASFEDPEGEGAGRSAR